MTETEKKLARYILRLYDGDDITDEVFPFLQSLGFTDENGFEIEEED